MSEDQTQDYAEICRLKAEEEAALLADVIPPEIVDDESSAPDSDFIESCLLNNERGDGILYARLLRDKFVNVKKRGSKPWLVWRNHHWDIDLMGENIRAVEKVALAYKDEAFKLDEPIREASAKMRDAEKAVSMAETVGDAEAKAEAEALSKSYAHTVKLLRSRKEKYIRRVDRLRGKAGAEKTTWWAHHIDRPLAISGDEIDQHRMLLAAPNGVIDIFSGELRPGRPQDYLLNAINIAYPADLDQKRILHYLDTGEDCPCPAWNKFAMEIVSTDPDGGDDGSGVPQFFQKMAGYSITGDTRYHLITVAVGGGRNGKGTFFRTAKAIFGQFYWTIQSELLLDNKNSRNTAGASPDIMMLRGRRFVVASETNKHRYIDAARVKEYSGGDPLNARGLFDAEEENFIPTHKLWLQSNNIPTGITSDFALRQRIALIFFPWRYVPDIAQARKKDPHLAEFFRLMDPDLEAKLTAEHAYIILWFLRGAILMQREGPRIPARVRADLDDLQLQEDNIEQYLRACCLQDWDSERDNYSTGDFVNLPDPDEPDSAVGLMYACEGNPTAGVSPLDDAEAWRYQGRKGLDPKGSSYFKEFYGLYKKWFEENVTDKKDKIPSQKSVAADLRKKGYKLETHGGQLQIYNGGVIVLGVIGS